MIHYALLLYFLATPQHPAQPRTIVVRLFATQEKCLAWGEYMAPRWQEAGMDVGHYCEAVK